MSWVYDKEADAFERGYNSATTQASDLLKSENLVCLAKWLKERLAWERHGKHKQLEQEMPRLPDFLQKVEGRELAILDLEAERLKRAAPEMLRVLKMLYMFHAQGAYIFRSNYDFEKMGVAYLADLARHAIKEAEGE